MKVKIEGTSNDKNKIVNVRLEGKILVDQNLAAMIEYVARL